MAGASNTGSKTIRDKLRHWLETNYGSTFQALNVFDLDADGSLSGLELSRVLEQAGIDAEDKIRLLEVLGCTKPSVFTARCDDLASKIEGFSVPKGVRPRPAPLVSPDNTFMSVSGLLATSEIDKSQPPTAKTQTFKGIALEAAKVCQAQEAKLLDLLSHDHAEPFMSREQQVITLLCSLPWASIVCIKDHLGSSLLHLLCNSGMHQACEKLLQAEGLSNQEREAFVNLRNAMDWTSLLLAAQKGHINICATLLSYHADPNLATGTRLTPLMLAASGGHVAIVQHLLDPTCSRPLALRADPMLTTLEGRSALDLVHARQKLQPALRERLPSSIDSYGVAVPLLALQSDHFQDVKRMLEAVTRSGTALGELRMDLLLAEPGEEVPGMHRLPIVARN